MKKIKISSKKFIGEIVREADQVPKWNKKEKNNDPNFESEESLDDLRPEHYLI